MTESELQIAVAREDLCRYLSACYYEPEAAFEDEGMFAALLAAAKLAGPDLVPSAERLGQEFRRTSIDELLLDYSRLFIGPMQILAKPYGSVWLDEEKTLMGNSTMALLELYREADFEMDEEFKELPDHIAVELEFLYQLLFRENEARMINDEQILSVIHTLRQRFLSQHLGAWITRFSAAIKEGAQSSFYRELADLTEVFVKQQPSWVRI
jgi:putative dimethyl sulfoxide reductase chaperone